MKKMILSVMVLASLTSQAADLDLSKSKVSWVGKKEVVDSKHTGVVKFKSGSLKVEDGKLTGGSVVVDMATITATDLEGEWADKLVGHLKNDDFFKVGKYPTSTFTAKKVAALGSDKFKVTGDLKILDKTNEVSVVLAKSGKTYKGDLTFDRTKWDLKYGSGSFFDNLGDKAISNDITINLELVTK